MKIEELDKVLTHHAIYLDPVVEKDGEFNRHRVFSALGEEYLIQWWVNIAYLFIGNVQIVFDSVRVQGTWPNGFKNNLQFYNAAGNVVCIIPIEEYQKEESL